MSAGRDLNTPRVHNPVLTRPQLDQYEADGFITIRGVLGADLLGRLTATTERLLAEGARLTERTRHYDLDASHTPGAPRIRRIASPTELDDVYLEAAFESVLGDIAADLVGGPVKFYHSKVNFKLPRGGAEIGWHQDWPVFPHTNTNLVAISVPLNPSRAGNGCLQTIPGTHKLGPRSHWHQGKYLLNCNASMTEEELRRAVYSELDPGDIVAHHGLSLHSSSQNRSDDLRTTYIIQYAAADAFAYTAPVIDSCHRNAMVRGVPATHARVDAGLVELPPDFSAGYSGIYSLQTAAKG
ncbi:MAG TPA: phytanoyl-CoA dioxygenase family protein [Chloroflexota bacterium]|nr:phytanoyl-CoA dioxygenase family protein [Chloroflexota bacterium]